MEIMTDFIFLCSKITADSNCSHAIKTRLLLGGGWKYDKPIQFIKKQRHHFANKSPYSQSYGFSSSHYVCENRTTKNAECQRIDAFEL